MHVEWFFGACKNVAIPWDCEMSAKVMTTSICVHISSRKMYRIFLREENNTWKWHFKRIRKKKNWISRRCATYYSYDITIDTIMFKKSENDILKRKCNRRKIEFQKRICSVLFTWYYRHNNAKKYQRLISKDKERRLNFKKNIQCTICRILLSTQ